MKLLFWSTLLLTALQAGAANRPAWFVDPTIQSRLGFDSNPVAAGGAAGPILGEKDALVGSLAASFGVGLPAAASAETSGRITYAAETVQFEGWASEDFTTHRLTAVGQTVISGWRVAAEASYVLVDGSHDGLTSTSAINAHALTLWRERRAQSQHRAKLQVQRTIGPWLVRGVASWIDHDFRVAANSGCTTFTDREEVLGGFDLGRRPAKESLWFAGVRIGEHIQDRLAPPATQYDYSSRFVRPIAGWEGRLGQATTLALATGPDFRDFNGNIDRKVFSRREHTAFWFEGSLSSKLGRDWTLSGKAMRWMWLSSTGRAACMDFATELSLGYAVRPDTTLRLTGKVHQITYFPSVRNDWESLAGLGLTRKIGSHTQLTFDVVSHEGWNAFNDIPDRAFSRWLVNAGVAIKL